MAYSSDISSLGADHHWKFDGNSNDAIGSVTATDTGMAYTGSPIAEDATNSALMNARGDRVSLANTTTISNSIQARKAVCGWFMVDAKELPSCRIYGEGNNTTTFQFIIFPGNSIMLEIRDDTNFQVQIYSDIAVANSRAYHLCGILEGSGYGNEVRFYIDGVEQTAADPSDRQPDDASLAARNPAEFGDPAGTVGINGVALLMQSPGDNRTDEQVINAYYQHWAAWGDKADAVLTDTEVRETLFERGALADVTISSGTESAMQTALDAYADTVRGDAPLCIEVEAVSGGGDFTLDLDNITFNALASCHVRYNGTADTLTLRNTNGSDCSIVSAPFGGTIEVFTEVVVKVTVKSASDLSVVVGARVLLEADTGGDLTAGTDIISAETNASGIATVDFDYSSNQPVVGVVRKGSSSTYFQEGTITGTITEDGFDLTILLVEDE
jgi:hypothetical protein